VLEGGSSVTLSLYKSYVYIMVSLCYNSREQYRHNKGSSRETCTACVASTCFLCRLVNPVSAVTSAWYSNAAYHNQDLHLVTQVVCQGMQHFGSYTWSDGSV